MIASHEKYSVVDRRLRTEQIIWLTTVTPEGRPYMRPVWFLWDGVHISIFSKPIGQKMINLQTNPNTTLALEVANEGADVAIVDGTAKVFDSTVLPEPYVEKYRKWMEKEGWSVADLTSSANKLIQVTPTGLTAW